MTPNDVTQAPHQPVRDRGDRSRLLQPSVSAVAVALIVAVFTYSVGLLTPDTTVSGRQWRRTINARPTSPGVVTNSADVPVVARLTLCCGVRPLSHCRTYSSMTATHASRLG